MKLIDLLVQELPKRGGWPEYAENAVQDKSDTEIYFFSGDKPHLAGSYWHGAGSWFFTHWENELSDDWDRAIVSREQYEAALAASKQPEWSGEGLPPEGIDCEVKSGKDSWTLCKVVHSSAAGVAFIYLEEPEPYSFSKYLGTLDCIGHKYAGSQLRPIRTEAERKRDNAISAMIAILKEGTSTNDDARDIYLAISEGKIPGIRLE